MPFNKKKQCRLCEDSTYEIVTETNYTRKELVMMESSIVEFHQDIYIPAIQKLAFHLPHVRIIGAHHCVNTRQEALKRHSDFQDVLRHCDYAELIVARFSHQIKSEYYGGNMSVSIECITLEQFSTTYQETP